MSDASGLTCPGWRLPLWTNIVEEFMAWNATVSRKCVHHPRIGSNRERSVLEVEHSLTQHVQRFVLTHKSTCIQ